MSILVNKDTRVVVQGITGREGEFHARQMLDYGTNVVAGVTPGKEGNQVHGLPVYNQVKTAIEKHEANASVIFVPAAFAMDAIVEALDAGIKLIVCITEGIPVQDMLKVVSYARSIGANLIGPNSPGITTPGEAKLGIMPGRIFSKGSIGIVSRSGTLTYEVVNSLSQAGIGQSTCVGMGGDPILGMDFVDILSLFSQDPATKGIVLIGEIGGTDEEKAAEFINGLNLPVVAFIAGKTAPPGKKMGHAGAIISGSTGTAEAKIKAFNRVGVPVADTIPQIVDLVKEVISSSVK